MSSPFFQNCWLCNAKRQMSDGIYNLKKCEGWGVFVCLGSCHAMNHDGWNLGHERRFIDLAKEKNIDLPTRNKNGLLPRDF
jgi:hypothetical protein